MKKFIQKVREYFGKVYMYALTGPIVAAGFDLDKDVPTSAPGLTLTTLETWIRSISTFLISVGVVIAAIFIIWGGIGFMLAGGNPEKAGAAKTRLMNGIIGALIVLGVGLILRTIGVLVAGNAFNK